MSARPYNQSGRPDSSTMWPGEVGHSFDRGVNRMTEKNPRDYLLGDRPQSFVESEAVDAAPAATAGLERRRVLAGSGLAVLGGLLSAGAARGQNPASADQWDEVEKQNVRVVEEFCDAWATRDLANVNATLAENCIYRMTETTPPVYGHDGLAEQMQGWIDSSHTIVFEILQTVAKGPIVMNHRIDYWMSDTRPVTWEGVGVFFLQAGKIVEWSDYSIRVERG